MPHLLREHIAKIASLETLLPFPLQSYLSLKDEGDGGEMTGNEAGNLLRVIDTTDTHCLPRVFLWQTHDAHCSGLTSSDGKI